MLHLPRALEPGSRPGARPVPRLRRILVAEDETIQAEVLQQELEDLGVDVLGPVRSVAAALALLAAGTPLDAAILDVKLGGEMAFPVAEALRARRIPFIFATGYDPSSLPSAYAHVPCCEKPIDVGHCLWTLFGQTVMAQ